MIFFGIFSINLMFASILISNTTTEIVLITKLFHFFCSSNFFFCQMSYSLSDLDHFSFKMIISSNRFSEIYSLIIILEVLDFTILIGLYWHGVLHHQSKKHEVNSDELDVLFDQFVEENSCISLRIT